MPVPLFLFIVVFTVIDLYRELYQKYQFYDSIILCCATC
jgi:hypothetical protein